MNSKITIKPYIIDCTIRDGGHLNNWNFDNECVKASFFASIKSGSDYFEIGYRFPATHKGLGNFAYCDDDFLINLLGNSSNGKILVMIDAGKSDASLFCDYDPQKTIVSGVRVAAYPYELVKAISTIEELHKKGYKVFLNLMASAFLEKEHLDILGEWKNKDILEAVSFADSFGSYTLQDIPPQIDRLKNLGFSNIGFHGHNNLQMAFANTLQAIDSGALFIDASIYGMGRGTGNLPLEVLVGFLEKQNLKSYNTVPLLDVIDRYYVELFEQFDWGYKIKSLLGGLSNIHPYYVDEIYSRKDYTVEEIWNALSIIKEQCPISFSVEKLNNTLNERFYKTLDEESVKQVVGQLNEQLFITPAADAFFSKNFSLKNKWEGRKFIIIGNGSSIVNNQEKISKFIKDENCISIGLNYLKSIYNPDYHLFVSKKRFLKYANTVSIDSELIIPSFFGKEFVQENWNRNLTYIDIHTTDGDKHLPIEDEQQYIVNLNVAISAILLAVQLGASEIYAVGIDGYVGEDDREIKYFYNEDDIPEDKNIASIRYEKFTKELERINKYLLSISIPFSIITPTSHKKYYNNKLK